MPLASPDRKFSYDDYLTWPEGERWEIIDGVAYDMTPAPTLLHQRLVLRFGSLIDQGLRDRRCTVLVSPVDIVFSKCDVVQPDVVVVCDPTKLTKENIQGAPDVVIEVLSPSTSLKDRREKFELYETHGVREYLIVDPEGKTVEKYELGGNGKFQRPHAYGPGDVLMLRSMALEILLSEVFEAEKKEAAPE